MRGKILHIKKGDIINVGNIAGCLLGGMNKYQIADYRNFATLTTILQLRNDKARGKITVKPHKLFRREGTNLRLEVPISFTQAALGAEIDVPTLDGSVKYTIPEGTQTDTEFRIRGKGIQQLGSNNKGDLIFKVRVETPRRLTEKQRELLRQFDGDDNGKQYDQRKTFIDKVKELFDK